MKELIKAQIDVAVGRKKAQLVFKNINLVNVFTGEVYKTNVAVHNGYIAGIGDYSGAEELDMEGMFLCPGFIDGHVHIESSMVTPGEFSKAIVPRGTTAIIADPHEIANVKGIEGIEYMLDESENLPLDVFIMLPSCVPATPFENAGDVLKADDLYELIDHPRVLGLGELMDFPSLLNCDKNVINKVTLAKKFKKFIDGHGPGIKDKELNGYVIPGIRTEHECTTKEEAVDRLRLGMHVMLREGSAARNLVDLLPAMTESSISRCFFCTDDRHPDDILQEGHIDNNIRLAIKNGVPPVKAIQMATINAATCYHLEGLGAIAPGYRADLVILRDLENVEIYQVYKEGKLVAQEGKALFESKKVNDSRMRNSVKIKPLHQACFEIDIGENQVNVIGLIPHSLVTKNLLRDVVKDEKGFKTKEGTRLLKVAVIERHQRTGNIGVGLVEGLGLENGAIASSIAHDSHNIVVIGDNDRDVMVAVEHLQKIGGGISIASQGNVIQSLSLPIGGIMSDQPLDTLQHRLSAMLNIAYEMGVSKDYDPFMTLSFLALPVIPELKITDLGLFDVVNYKFIKSND